MRLSARKYFSLPTNEINFQSENYTFFDSEKSRKPCKYAVFTPLCRYTENSTSMKYCATHLGERNFTPVMSPAPNKSQPRTIFDEKKLLASGKFDVKSIADAAELPVEDVKALKH